jgi:HK97 family phage prohead protease
MTDDITTIEVDSVLEVRDAEQRLIAGRIIPYGERIVVKGRPESFVRGALADVDITETRLLAHHDRTRPIGRGVEMEEREDGAYAVFRVSQTREGDEMLALAADGVLQFSPGFIPRDQSADGVHRRVAALPETSLVTFAAYPSANVLAVRESDHMPENQNVETVDLTALEQRMDTLAALVERVQATVDAPAPAKAAKAPTPIEWFAAQVEALDGKSTQRREALASKWDAFQTRALDDITGGETGAGDLSPASDLSGLVVEEFLGAQLVNVLDRRRRVFSRLGSFSMPRSGYARIPVVAQHTEVGVRAGQKDPANSRKLIVQTQPFEAVWYDGAVDVALEVIRQAELPVLAMVWDDLLGQYAIATEAGVVDAIEAGGHGFAYTGTALDVTDYEGFITDIATQAIEVEEGSGAPATLVALTKAQWIAVIAMVDATGRRVFSTVGASNADASAAVNASSITLPGGIEVFYGGSGLTQAFVTNEQSLKVADGGPERVEAVNVELMGRDLGVLGRTLFVPRIPAGVVVYGVDPDES